MKRVGGKKKELCFNESIAILENSREAIHIEKLLLLKNLKSGGHH